MTGNSLNIGEQEKRIESWMDSTFRDGGIERFDHLHIDKIDSSWKNKDRWIEAALLALSLACIVKDRLGLGISIMSAISLDSEKIRNRSLQLDTRQALTDCLSWTPPSLYLFRANDRFWMPAEGSAEMEFIPLILPLESFAPFEYMAFLYKPVDGAEESLTLFVS